MRILGLNSPTALPDRSGLPGHPLSDGGAAFLDNGTIAFAAIEERHSRTRYSGGFNRVLAAAALPFASQLSQMDAVAFSSCCGPSWHGAAHADHVRQLVHAILPDCIIPKVVFVGHHTSHASLGFMLSGYQDALVAVVDGFGNLLYGDNWSQERWWSGSFERHSYYHCRRTMDGRFTMQLLGRDADGPEDIGLGELYSALTHFSGYTSYQHAGTVMALSAFADDSVSSTGCFVHVDDDHLQVTIKNDHPHKAEAFANHLAKAGYRNMPVLLHQADASNRKYCNIVAAVQSELEESLVRRVSDLSRKHGLERVVVTGGVALNCLAMAKLNESIDGEVFIPPAPGDTGQALGNALWACYCAESPLAKRSLPPFQPYGMPFWGIPIPEASVQKAIELTRSFAGIMVLDVKSPEDQAQMAAQALAEEKLVATCLGRSEYGPRALGARSVLADPRNRDIVKHVNSFKQREPFRPFGPAILEERAGDYFQSQVDSPFMSFALELKVEKSGRIPAVAHADSTARLQTVGKDSPSPLRPILEAFEKQVGVPVLLNTSFNRKGEPMIETPEEAVKLFIDSGLDMLLLDGFVLKNTNSNI